MSSCPPTSKLYLLYSTSSVYEQLVDIHQWNGDWQYLHGMTYKCCCIWSTTWFSSSIKENFSWPSLINCRYGRMPLSSLGIKQIWSAHDRPTVQNDVHYSDRLAFFFLIVLGFHEERTISRFGYQCQFSIQQLSHSSSVWYSSIYRWQLTLMPDELGVHWLKFANFEWHGWP